MANITWPTKLNEPLEPSFKIEDLYNSGSGVNETFIIQEIELKDDYNIWWTSEEKFNIFFPDKTSTGSFKLGIAILMNMDFTNCNEKNYTEISFCSISSNGT